MAKADLGEKRDCPECGTRFYDLTKSPAHCPKCDHEFVPEALLKPRKTGREEEVVDPKEDEKEKETKPAEEIPLDSADDQNKGASSNKRADMDGDNSDGDDEDDDELAGLDDITIDIDDDDDEADDNTSVLVNDEDNDVTDIVRPTGDDE